MTSRPRTLILAAACAALFAIAFANVARAQQGCFMDCNRAPMKADEMSSAPLSSDHMGAMKKRHTRAHHERRRHDVEP